LLWKVLDGVVEGLGASALGVFVGSGLDAGTAAGLASVTGAPAGVGSLGVDAL